MKGTVRVLSAVVFLAAAAAETGASTGGVLGDLLPTLGRGFFESQEDYEQKFEQELRAVLERIVPVSEDVRFSFSWMQNAGSEGRPSRSCVSIYASWEREGLSYRAEGYNSCGNARLQLTGIFVFTKGKTAPGTREEFIELVNSKTFLSIADAEEGVAAGFVSAGKGSFQTRLSEETNAVCVAFLPDQRLLYIPIPGRIELRYLPKF